MPSTNAPSANMPSMVPFIPGNAPFSPEQRAWLNGFLAGVFSSAAPSTHREPEPAGLKIAVLYASQSGTSERLARKLAKELKSKGHTVSISSLEGYTPAALAAERYALMLASTYGEGDAPDAVQPFYEQLCLERFPRYENLSYSVLALGDKQYEHFCKFGIDLDARLASLGANRICGRVDCDLEVDEPFAQWKGTVLHGLDELAASERAQGHIKRRQNGNAAFPAAGSPKPSNPGPDTHTHTRENPFAAALVEKRPLTTDVSSKLTLHMAFSIKDSAIQYEAGDACGVIPHNDPLLVESILETLHFTGEERVELAKVGSVTLQEALLHHLQVTRLSRKIIDSYGTMGQCGQLLALLAPEQQTHLDRYAYDRGFIDLLEEFPGVVRDPAESGCLAPQARSAPLFHLVQPPRPSRGNPHHGRRRALSFAQSQPWRCLLHAPGGSHAGWRTPAHLRPAQQEISFAERSRCAGDHDRTRNRDRSVSRLPA